MTRLNVSSQNLPYSDHAMKNTYRHILVLLGTLIVLVFVAACGNESDTADSASEPAATTARESSEQATGETDAETETDDGVVVIEMFTRGGAQYNDPIGVHVEPGTTIRFVNRTGTHTATAYHPSNRNKSQRIPDDAEPWDSGVLSGRNAEFEITLTVEGVYDYLCTLHEAQGHVGRIVVGDPSVSPALSTDNLPGRAPEFLPEVEDIIARGVIPFEG